MTNEHEPLWSDERIAKFTHTTYVVADVVAIIPIELMRNLITAVRDDYEARIAELEDEARQWREAYEEMLKVADYEDTRITELEAQLAQTWQPLPDGLIEKNEGKVSALLSGNGSVFSVTDGYVMNTVRFKTDTYRLCRLVERDEPQPTIPPDVREAIRKLADYGMPLGATNMDWRHWRDTTLTWLDEQNKNE